MAYIYPAPGVSGVQATLSISVASNVSDSGMNVPALQDVTVNAANDVFTWTQLDAGSKLQIATTATNSLGMNLVLDQAVFFGTGDGADEGSTINTAAEYGIFGLSKDKVLIDFDLYLGDTSTGSNGKTISGQGYITGLAPTVSADAPVWVSPITITVTGDYTVA
jgi:hypothetical protein